MKVYLKSAAFALWFLLALPTLTWFAADQFREVSWYSICSLYWLAYAFIITYYLGYGLVTKKE